MRVFCPPRPSAQYAFAGGVAGGIASECLIRTPVELPRTRPAQVPMALAVLHNPTCRKSPVTTPLFTRPISGANKMIRSGPVWAWSALVMAAILGSVAARGVVQGQDDLPHRSRRASAAVDASDTPHPNPEPTRQVREGSVLKDELGTFQILGDRVVFSPGGWPHPFSNAGESGVGAGMEDARRSWQPPMAYQWHGDGIPRP